MSTPRKKNNKSESKPGTIKSEGSRQPVFIFLILLGIFLAYIPAFNAGFVNWDDEDYVLNNISLQSNSFKEIISTPVQGNYHPLTMLSLAFNHAISGNNPFSYHALNVLLHMLNSVLVFFFILRLSKRTWMAFIAALLFGIHPLHVESVAWVSERKDLLYSLFFLLGMHRYLLYVDKRKFTDLALVFLCFILSLLSKPAAIIFPLVLLTLDFHQERLKELKAWLEKVPFFVLSLLMGILTLHGQASTGARALAEVFSLADRFLFASYGIMMYLYKAILPSGLCTFYPFPELHKSLPTEYYLSLVVPLLLIFFFLKSLNKKRLFAFAVLFYVVNLLLVLQLVPVGNAVIADRYAYLPLLGLIIIPSFYLDEWMTKERGKYSFGIRILLFFLSIILIILTYRQSSTWKNGEALWDHAIKVHPSSRAYVNRAMLYKKKGNIDKAFEAYSKAIEIGTKEPDAWVNRGNIFFSRMQFDKAIEDYNQCLLLNSKQRKAYENRGAAYASLGKTDLALRDLDKAIELDSLSTEALSNRATLFMNLGKFDMALHDIHQYLELKDDPEGKIWSLAAEANFNLGNYAEALDCYNHVILAKQDGIAYMNRSKIFLQLNRKEDARKDVQKAIEYGIQVDPAYMDQLK